MSERIGIRGAVWFRALTGQASPMPGDPDSVLTADASVGEDSARFLCVVRDPHGRFPCARDGQVGLEEAYTLATRVREVIEQDTKAIKRPIIAIVDVKSQAYGRREETAAIFLAAAAAADAYGAARIVGHPVLTLVVGNALSGGFLTHGYQANRILAFDDDGVMIHAMHKEAAARITRRSVESLEKLGETIAPLSYDIRDYARLGLLHKLLHVDSPENPSAQEIQNVRNELIEAIKDARNSPVDLRNRLQSKEAPETRKASILTRAMLEAQWAEEQAN
jgi:malonate decarboxylase gamma subunit